MNQELKQNFIIDRNDPVLVTGGAGFIGSAVVEDLLQRGFENIICITRSTRGMARLAGLAEAYPRARVDIVEGNLLSNEDCRKCVRDVRVVLHLAAGRGEKFVPDAYLNSVVTTRNLLEACAGEKNLRRFVNVSSFTVYTNAGKRKWRLLDETCPVESRPEHRGDAYTYAKVKQDEMVEAYGQSHKIPYVIVRPGSVYGTVKGDLSNRVGIATFGPFLHLGGSNQIPLSYVENCADAIVLAGLVPGVDGEVINVVDDNLPSSRRLLALYKRNVRRFHSIYVPKLASYLLCYLWERYSHASQGQLPPAFNRPCWRTFWRKTNYSNRKLKERLGWSQRVATDEGLKRFFEASRLGGANA